MQSSGKQVSGTRSRKQVLEPKVPGCLVFRGTGLRQVL